MPNSAIRSRYSSPWKTIPAVRPPRVAAAMRSASATSWVRLWPLVADAIRLAQEATVYDNSSATHAHRVVTQFISGRPFGNIDWPEWAPAELVALAT